MSETSSRYASPDPSLQRERSSSEGGRSGRPEPPAMLAPALSAIGLGLLILFGIAVFSQLFPLRLLMPAWQLRIAGVLIERGPQALLGLVLLQLAAYLDSTAARLQARWHTIGRLGVIAVLGFLLLLPLQLVAAGRSIHGMSRAQRSQQERVDRNLSLLRQQIRVASSFPDLQRRIRDIQAPDLVVQADALQQPLPQLKRQLLASVDQSERQLRLKLGRGGSGRTWAVLERSGRGLVSSLVLAFCFAATTPLWLVPQQSLLMFWLRKWRRLWSRRPRKGAVLSEKDYIRQLSREAEDER